MKASRLLAGLVLLPVLAIASTLIPHTLRQRAERADRVALVQVVSQRVERTADPQFPLKTFTQIVVGQDFKGTGPSTLTVVQIGGTDGPLQVQVPGDAEFRVGETAVVFLTCGQGPERCHLVALGSGKLNVEGEHVFVQDLFTSKWSRLTLSQLAGEVAVGVRQ